MCINYDHVIALTDFMIRSCKIASVFESRNSRRGTLSANGQMDRMFFEFITTLYPSGASVPAQKKREKIIHLFFISVYSIKLYFGDINFDSPINSLSHNLMIMTLRL